MLKRLALAAAVVGFTSIALAAEPATTPATSTAMTKKLIEFGWDQPTAAFLRAHIAEMEKTPFDGTVFAVQWASPDGQRHDFLNAAWGTRAFTPEELRPALLDLKATHFTTFTDNFLRFDVTPGDVDWFDDYSAILNNAKLIAGIAKDGGAKGLLFDIEQYNAHLFDYSKQRDAKKRPFATYAAQARRRGREVMTAFQSGYPGLTVFMTYASSLAYATAHEDRTKLDKASYGLLAPFMNGMVDAADGATRIVDGYEMSYGFKQPAEFADGIQYMRQRTTAVVANPRKYNRVLSCGFGLWMDFDWRKKGWNASDPSKNYFTPQAFAAAARAALETSDQYVWIYTEKPWWWTRDGATKELPDAYIKALQQAKTAANEPHAVAQP